MQETVYGTLASKTAHHLRTKQPGHCLSLYRGRRRARERETRGIKREFNLLGFKWLILRKGFYAMKPLSNLTNDAIAYQENES